LFRQAGLNLDDARWPVSQATTALPRERNGLGKGEPDLASSASSMSAAITNETERVNDFDTSWIGI
jgi:hypothetical protein